MSILNTSPCLLLNLQYPDGLQHFVNSILTRDTFPALVLFFLCNSAILVGIKIWAIVLEGIIDRNTSIASAFFFFKP